MPSTSTQHRSAAPSQRGPAHVREAWHRRFTPEAIEDLALSDRCKDQLTRYYERGVFPDLLLHGPNGVGKTTVAELLADRYADGSPLERGPGDTGMQFIQEEVQPYIAGWGDDRRVVLLDEVDQLSDKAQKQLRDVINVVRHKERPVRFLLTTNYPDRVEDGVEDRCKTVPMDMPPEGSQRALLERLCNRFDASNRDRVLEEVGNHPSMRSLLDAAGERAYGTPTPNLTEAQRATLRAIGRIPHEECSYPRLAEALDMSKGGAHQRVMKLVDKKLVEKEPVDGQNRPCLTERGREVLGAG